MTKPMISQTLEWSWNAALAHHRPIRTPDRSHSSSCPRPPLFQLQLSSTPSSIPPQSYNLPQRHFNIFHRSSHQILFTIIVLTINVIITIIILLFIMWYDYRIIWRMGVGEFGDEKQVNKKLHIDRFVWSGSHMEMQKQRRRSHSSLLQKRRRRGRRGGGGGEGGGGGGDGDVGGGLNL